MTHTWITATYFLVPDSNETASVLIEHSTPQEYAEQLREIYIEVAKELNVTGTFYPTQIAPFRWTIQGPNGFCVVEATHGYTEQEMINLGYIDGIKLDSNVWGWLQESNR